MASERSSDQSTPPEILEAAKVIDSILVPKKPDERYEIIYQKLILKNIDI